MYLIRLSDDLDELEVYGADTKGTELASYSFEVILMCRTLRQPKCVAFEHLY